MTQNQETADVKDQVQAAPSGSNSSGALFKDAYSNFEQRPPSATPVIPHEELQNIVDATKIARDVADDGEFTKDTRDLLLKSLADGTLAKDIELANKQLAAQGSDLRLSEHEFTEKMKYQTADEHRPGVTSGMIKDNPRADIQVMNIDTGKVENGATLKLDEAIKGYRKPEPVFPTPMEITPLSK